MFRIILAAAYASGRTFSEDEAASTKGHADVRAVLASHNQELYNIHIESPRDIAAMIGAPHIEALSVGRRLDFWTTPSLRPGYWQPNGPATRLLLALSDTFSGSTVPLLRGDIVITARDSSGALLGLDEPAIDSLAELVDNLPLVAEYTVQWRIRGAERANIRRRRRERASRPPLHWTPLPHTETCRRPPPL